MCRRPRCIPWSFGKKRHEWMTNECGLWIVMTCFHFELFWTKDSHEFLYRMDHYRSVLVWLYLRKHWAWTLELGTTRGWGALATDDFSHDTGIEQKGCAGLWLSAGMVTCSKRLSSLCEVELGCQNLMHSHWFQTATAWVWKQFVEHCSDSMNCCSSSKHSLWGANRCQRTEQSHAKGLDSFCTYQLRGIWTWEAVSHSPTLQKIFLERYSHTYI